MALPLETKADVVSQYLKDRDENDHLRTQLFNVQHEVSQEQDKREKQQRAIVKLDGEKRALQLQNNELSQQLSDAKAEISKQRRVAFELQGEIQEALSAKNDFLDKYRHLAQEKADMQRKVDTALKRCETTETSLTEMAEERAVLKREVEAKNKTLRDVQVIHDITEHGLAAEKEKNRTMSGNVHRDFETVSVALAHLVNVASAEMEEVGSPRRLQDPGKQGDIASPAKSPDHRVDTAAGMNISTTAQHYSSHGRPQQPLALELSETVANVSTAANVQLQLSKLGVLVSELRAANNQAARMATANKEDRRRADAELQAALAENAKLSSRLSVAETRATRYEHDANRFQRELSVSQETHLKLLGDAADVLQCAPTADSVLSEAQRVINNMATMEQRLKEQQDAISSLRKEQAKQKADHVRALDEYNKKAHEELNDVSRSAHQELVHQNTSLLDTHDQLKRTQAELDAVSARLDSVTRQYKESLDYASDMERRSSQLKAELESAEALNAALKNEKSAYERVVDGRSLQHQQQGAPMTDSRGNISAASLITRDGASNKANTNALEHAFRILLHAAYGMSQDIKELCQQRNTITRHAANLDAALRAVEDTVRYTCMTKHPGTALLHGSDQPLTPCMKLRRCAIAVVAAMRLRKLARHGETYVFKSSSGSASIYPRVRLPPLDKPIDTETFVYPSILDRNVCSVVNNMLNQLEPHAERKRQSSYSRRTLNANSLASKLNNGLMHHLVQCKVMLDAESRAVMVGDLVSKYLAPEGHSASAASALSQDSPQRSHHPNTSSSIINNSGTAYTSSNVLLATSALRSRRDASLLATAIRSPMRSDRVGSAASVTAAPHTRHTTEVPVNYPTLYSRQRPSSAEHISSSTSRVGGISSINAAVSPFTTTASRTPHGSSSARIGSAAVSQPNKAVSFSTVSPVSHIVSPSRQFQHEDDYSDAHKNSRIGAGKYDRVTVSPQRSQTLDVSAEVLNVIRALDERVAGALHRSRASPN